MKIITIKRALLVVPLFSILSSFAQTTKWIAPAATNNVKNPVATTADLLKNTKVVYTTNCAPCHGDKGKGDGPAAAALSPKPADHSSSAIQAESDGSLFWKLSTGRNAMPSYKGTFSDQQRWALIDYIRTLKKK